MQRPSEHVQRGNRPDPGDGDRRLGGIQLRRLQQDLQYLWRTGSVMTMPCLRERFLGDERGFTLTEVLVTTIIMMFVLLALAGLFDTGLKVFSFGNNKVEAVESARIGLQKMEREIRQAYKVNSAASQNQLFFITGSSPPP